MAIEVRLTNCNEHTRKGEVHSHVCTPSMAGTHAARCGWSAGGSSTYHARTHALILHTHYLRACVCRCIAHTYMHTWMPVARMFVT